MASPDLVMYEEEYQQIKDTLQRLQVDSNSKIVFLVDKNGQQIAAHGDIENLDTTSLASLTAGNVAATDGLARLIGDIVCECDLGNGAELDRLSAQLGSITAVPRDPMVSSSFSTTFRVA